MTVLTRSPELAYTLSKCWIRRMLMNEPVAHNTWESYLTRSAKAYLEGQHDWKWIMATVKQSAFDKQQARQILLPLKNHGWKFRSQALFNWLEMSRSD